MKKLFIHLACVFTLIATAQAPQGFNYQSTVRNNLGSLIINQSVIFKFNILQDSNSGLVVYSENQTTITDDLGHFNLVIGEGNPITGTFSSINWGSGTYYLSIELNITGTSIAIGTTQLLSVPYALYSNSSGNPQAVAPNLAAVLAVNNGGNNLQIKNLADPSDSQDAVTKGYSDLSDTQLQNQLQTHIASIQSQIAVPKKQHFLTTIENNIYLEEFQKKVLPNFALNTTVPIGLLRNNRIVAAYPTAGVYSTVCSLTDLSYNDIISKNYSIVVTDLSKTTPIKVLSIGDSYTDIGWYVKKMGETIPNITHLGTCNYNSVSDDVNREGRSGWDLYKYMNETGSTSVDGVFSPFIHPIAPYKYYGNTGFWKRVFENTAPQYEIGNLSHQLALLNINSMGVRATPNLNDVMYFTVDSGYKVWNGTSWNNIPQSTLNFTFNFAKYLTTWNIDTPDIVTILLGMNDFRNLNPNSVVPFFVGWKSNMDALIANVKLANPNAKIIIATCNSVESNDYCGKTNAALWESYNQIINTYDDRENENIFISDTKASADRVYGFGATRTVPFDQYVGSETMLITSGDVHLREGGMYQLGQKLAATIQYARD